MRLCYYAGSKGAELEFDELKVRITVQNMNQIQVCDDVQICNICYIDSRVI